MKLLPQIRPRATADIIRDSYLVVGFLEDFVGCFARSNGWARLFQPLM
jgi:hypothetical protein